MPVRTRGGARTPLEVGRPPLRQCGRAPRHGRPVDRATPSRRTPMPTPEMPIAPKEAQPPVGINHLVLNVRDLERSHRFWTEIMGFRQVAELKPKPNRPPMKMRFYSGVRDGEVTHHDLALMEVPAGAAPAQAGD